MSQVVNVSKYAFVTGIGGTEQLRAAAIVAKERALRVRRSIFRVVLQHSSPDATGSILTVTGKLRKDGTDFKQNQQSANMKKDTEKNKEEEKTNK